MKNRIEEVEKLYNYKTNPMIEWFNYYADYVEHNFRNIHNEACEYADKRQGNE